MLRPTGGQGRDILHRHEADERSARVQGLRYTLDLDLASQPGGYAGRAIVEFGLLDATAPLFLDFRGRPRAVVINGRAIEVDHRDHRLWLPADCLARSNRVEVDYENDYDATGDGFHRFEDPEDGEVYLYSNFEPFSAHRLFPCFDQPDLKASYELTVEAPAGWTVVSAEAPRVVEAGPAGRRRHAFPRTAVFSTYLMPLMAGPYERVDGRHEGLTLGVLGRRSMRRELERSADEIIEITARGMTYYADLFGRAYPFAKYDQLFVPEFNSGAMENVGAVTFADHYLFRDPPTYAQRLFRGEVILHELAHMWFGDLVTMRWWDDLWLNETFATYLSYRCLAEGTRFADAWQVFNGEMRPAAHRADQLVTTHPVATSVTSTDQAVGNFDAITYEKGAAVIKQLVAAIGDAAFRAGLERYFERHAWGNASLADFLAALGAAAGRPLDDWARLWLQTASLNEMAVHWRAEQGRIVALELEQRTLPGHATLRPHRTRLALLRPSSSGPGLEVESIAVTIEGARVDVPEAVGRPAPLFVFPDHGDQDYALTRLDPVSLAFALHRLPEIPEPLLRQQTWSTLFEQVRSASLRPTEYLAAVRRFAPLELDGALVSAILERAGEVLRRFLPFDVAQREAHALLEVALAVLPETRDDLRLVWLRSAVAVANEGADLAQLMGLADGSWTLDGFSIDQELRWQLAIKAAAFGLEGAEEQLDGELQRDPSDRGQRAFIRAQASVPDAAAKAETWRRIHEEGYGSDYLTRAAIDGFQWRHQRDLLLPFREPCFAQLEHVYATRDHAFASSYARGLVPDRWAETSVLERLRVLRAGLTPEQVLLGRHVDEIADDLARDIRVRAFGALTT